MSFLNELINNVPDSGLREALQDRLDIVIHKIKFIDKVPVFILSEGSDKATILSRLAEIAGAILVNSPEEAQVCLCFENNSGVAVLLSKYARVFDPSWPSSLYNRIYLVADEPEWEYGPETVLRFLENLAEMIHPGFFFFGNEGRDWLHYMR